MIAPQFRYSKMSMRYELSAKGREAFPGLRGGLIVGESRDKCCWRVICDGNKYPYSLHKSFVRVLDEAPQPSCIRPTKYIKANRE